MSMQSPSIDGLWSGWYCYMPVSITVPFSAWMFDSNGEIEGSTIEPNTFGDPSLKDLAANIIGQRGQHFIRFQKIYEPAPGAHSTPIIYTGSISADRKRIEGEWRLASEGRSVKGFYLLKRSSNPIRLTTNTFISFRLPDNDLPR